MITRPGTVKVVAGGGKEFLLHGDRDDPYFVNAQSNLDALLPFEAWARACLRPDATVIDAGGNIGLTALLLSRAVPHGHVHVFEALPRNADYLRRNIEANGITNCTVNHLALGNQNGTIGMLGAGSASHVVPSGSSSSEIVEVPVITLDDYVQDAGLKRVDLIKIDVEGSEPFVLEGAKTSIAALCPIIFMEFNTWCLSYIQNVDARSFAQLLWQSFDVTSIDGAGKEYPAGGGDVVRFFHDNVVLHGTVEDVILRLKPGHSVPVAGDRVPILPRHSTQAELDRLRAELFHLRGSNSWKVTAPLRSISGGLRSVVSRIRRP